MSLSELAAIRAVASAGPGFAALVTQGEPDWDGWRRAADRFESALPDLPGRERRIHHLYVPVVMWLATGADSGSGTG